MKNKRKAPDPDNQNKQKKAKRQESETFSQDDDDDPDDDDERLGMLESVTLRNFMCHENLKFHFTPFVNFIVGENGSGKSAILTAIILALGGKSSLTGRHPNLRSFIKTGKQSAVVSVTLSNRGSAAYKPVSYGSQITVERIITPDAASYKIKSAAGSIVSTSVKELTRIMDCFNIQIDNPISLLTQETSRTFLESKNPKDKYKLFFRATQLDKLQDGYIEAQNKCKESEISLKNRKEVLPEMAKKIKKWEFILLQASKIKDYENELVWAQVKEIEQEAKYKLKEFDKAKDITAAAKSSFGKAEEKHTKFHEEVDEAKAKIKACEEDKSNLKKTVQDLTTTIHPINTQIRELKVRRNKIHQDIDKNTREMKNLELNIAQIAEKSELDVSKEKEERDRVIHQLEKKATVIVETLEALGTERSKWIAKIHSEEKEKGTHILELKNLERLQTYAERDLNTMKSSIKDPVHIFGSEMQSLLRDIQQSARRFKQIPKGPIGMYLKVRDKEWSFAVENALNQNFLRNFCCDNLEDRDVLISLMERRFTHGNKAPSIIVSKFLDKVHDVRMYKVQSDHVTILDMLEIHNPVVGNCLIDQRHIERALLIKNCSDAVNLMMENPPKNCLFCYTPNGDQIYPSPKYRFYSCRRNPNSMCLLQSVKEVDLRSKQTELEKLASAWMMKNKQIESTNQLIKNYQKHNFEIISKLKNLNCSKETICQQLKDAKTYVEPKDLNCLKEDLELQLGAIKKLKRESDEMAHLSDKLKARFEELLKEQTQQRELFSEKSRLCSQLQDDLVEIEEKKECAHSERCRFENEYKRNNGRLSSVEREFNVAKAAAEKSASNALTICPRVHTERTKESIEAIIQETSKILENESLCKREQMKDKYLEQKKNFDKAKREIDELIVLNKKLEKMVVSRLCGFRTILKHTSLNLNYAFSVNLKTNKYIGRLDFNHDKETLSISAKPTERSTKSHQNTRELSGGERSYVTISLLLALWERVEMPFRILDEYDVFMDSVNRQLSLSIMIEATKEKKFQFIFLTPQELPVMNNTLARVHKMPAPQRCEN